MNGISFIKRAGIDVLKGSAAALASFTGLIVGSMLSSALGLPAVVMPGYISMSRIIPLMLLTLVLLAILLGECFQRLFTSYWQRLAAVFLCHYLLYYALNTLDGMLFTPFPHMSTGFVADLVPSLFISASIAWLWKPKGGSLPEKRTLAKSTLAKSTLAKSTPGFFSARKPMQWAWRLCLAWLVYPPLYYLAGRVVALFTLGYYQDPNLNLGLTLPTPGVLMAMQVLRGALFLLAVFPILLGWTGTRKGLWLQVGAVIFLQIAAQVILQAYWLPLGLRFPHTLELLADSFIQAGMYVWLLYTPRSTPSTIPSTPQETRQAHTALNSPKP